MAQVKFGSQNLSSFLFILSIYAMERETPVAVSVAGELKHTASICSHRKQIHFKDTYLQLLPFELRAELTRYHQSLSFEVTDILNFWWRQALFNKKLNVSNITILFNELTIEKAFLLEAAYARVNHLGGSIFIRWLKSKKSYFDLDAIEWRNTFNENNEVEKQLLIMIARVLKRGPKYISTSR